MRVSYQIVDGSSGGALDAGTVTPAPKRIRQSAGLTTTSDPRDDLFAEAAKLVAEKVRANISRVRPSAPGAEVEFEVHVTMADLTIPEVTKDPRTGEYVIGANRYQLEVSAANVLVDGMLVGSAPGKFRVRPGIHKLRVEHPLLEKTEYPITAAAGVSLTIPMKLTDEGLARWRSNAAFLDSLKDRQTLRDVEIEKAKAMAEFMRNSYVRLDTRNVTTLTTGVDLFWPAGR
jgi:hypothetical protein